MLLSLQAVASNCTSASTCKCIWAVRSDGGTPSSGTGPSAAQSGTRYVFMETSSPAQEYDASLLTYSGMPPNPRSVAFHYHMLGSGIGSLALEAFTASGWASIWYKRGQQSSVWLQTVAYLPTGTTQLRFVGVRGNTWSGDVALDAITVSWATSAPTGSPSHSPTGMPTQLPSASPTTRTPTKAGITWAPTSSPTAKPTGRPTPSHCAGKVNNFDQQYGDGYCKSRAQHHCDKARQPLRTCRSSCATAFQHPCPSLPLLTACTLLPRVLWNFVLAAAVHLHHELRP